MSQQEALICVQGAWNGWRTAEVRLRDLEHVHWLQPSRAPRQLVHGYISCLNVISGDIPHECDGTSGPHRLLVCVIKHHNTAGTYAEVARRANDNLPMPQQRRLAREQRVVS
jgi:hypothetical protein